ncbi:MAG TPA: tetratricopeptide repeat protein [Anaerolineales bacterium]|nr:tetratricopeptide repeat protein [Anaerolineales bacterium]
MNGRLEVRLLGKFDVRQAGKPVAITSRPAQSLFAYLILSAGTFHRREKLAGLLWPDSFEETARNNLRHALWRVRKALKSASSVSYLQANDLAIAFNTSTDYWLDAAALEKLGEQASADETIAVLSNYDGELLPGFYDEWIVLEREHLYSIFERHMARLLSLLQDEERWSDVLEWGERWIKLGQKPEPAYRALMCAHAARGDMSKVAATYDRCVKSLKEFEIEPSEQTRALYEQLKSRKETLKTGTTGLPAKVAGRPQTNVPVPLTSFVGRERELEEVKRLLSGTRLLTLMGAGGIGKTRLANQAAAELSGSYTDGIWWVELAPLKDPVLVPQTMAQVLAVRESPSQSWIESLENSLREKQLLLVLDNCEHLIDACAQLAHHLLSRCAHLKILATSREALGITGETVLQVPALSFPVLAHLSQLQNLRDFESVQLFVERAAAAQPDLALTQENAFAVTQICRRLDGIPLALELAAARVKILTLEEIARRLDDRFSLLIQGSRTALPRHQTLRATIDWSHELLSGPERILLRRLSVFAGGFTLEAAEAVVAEGEIARSQVIDLLGSLINKSLVILQAQSEGEKGETRYGTLETIRAYAREKLEEAGEDSEIRARHLEYFAAFAERAQKGIYGLEQAAWFRRLEQEVDNLRAALDWNPASFLEGNRSVQENPYVIIRSLSLFWERGYRSEIIETLKKLLVRDEGNEPSAERARALDVGGFLLWSLNRLPEARAFLEDSIQIAEKLEDDSIMVWPLMYLGWTFWGMEEYDHARKCLERSLAIARSLGEEGKGAVGVAIAYLGDIPYAEGDLPEARKLYEEAISLLRELQNPSMLTPSLRRLAYLEIREGKFAQASHLFRESLELNRQLSHQHGAVACLAGLAAIHLAKRNVEKAAVLYGCVEHLLRESGNPLLFTDTVEYERSLARLRKELDEATLFAVCSKGHAMTLDQAIEFALVDVQV